MMIDWDSLDELTSEELAQAEIIANEMMLVIGRHEADIDIAWSAIDMVIGVMQDMEEDELQQETHGLNGKEY